MHRVTTRPGHTLIEAMIAVATLGILAVGLSYSGAEPPDRLNEERAHAVRAARSVDAWLSRQVLRRATGLGRLELDVDDVQALQFLPQGSAWYRVEPFSTGLLRVRFGVDWRRPDGTVGVERQRLVAEGPPR